MAKKFNRLAETCFFLISGVPISFAHLETFLPIILSKMVQAQSGYMDSIFCTFFLRDWV